MRLVFAPLVSRRCQRAHLGESDPRVHANSGRAHSGRPVLEPCYRRPYYRLDRSCAPRRGSIRRRDRRTEPPYQTVHPSLASARTHIPIKAGFIPAISPRANISCPPWLLLLLALVHRVRISGRSHSRRVSRDSLRVLHRGSVVQRTLSSK